MSFGVVQSGIASINSNRKLLSKRPKFENGLCVAEDKKKELTFNREASKKELLLLRERMQHQNRITTIKLSIVLVIIAAAAMTLILSL